MGFIENYKLINRGALIASFDIVCDLVLEGKTYKDHVIRGCCQFEKGDSTWFTFPSREYEKDGKKKYFAHCGMKEIKTQNEFFEEVKKADKGNEKATEEIPF